MGITERKERQKKEMRENILNASWQLVNETGWQALSIRKIADAIEYSVPVVYEHFENKEAILFEFNKQGYKLLGTRLAEAKAANESAPEQLEAIAFAYWNFAFENMEFYQVMFGLGMPTCDTVKNMPEIMAFTNVIKSTIEDIIAENENTKANAFLKFHSFWSMLHGLVSINLMTPQVPHEGLTAEEVNKMVLNDFITGFLVGLEG